jgi:hypothetical protein
MERTMAYKRKTRDEWEMWSNYGYGWECELVEDSYAEACARIREYRENAPQGSYKLRKRRVRLSGSAG